MNLHRLATQGALALFTLAGHGVSFAADSDNTAYLRYECHMAHNEAACSALPHSADDGAVRHQLGSLAVLLMQQGRTRDEAISEVRARHVEEHELDLVEQTDVPARLSGRAAFEAYVSG